MFYWGEHEGNTVSSAEFNPYQSPQAPLRPQIVPDADVWQHGQLLVLRKGAVLPDRCVKCNATAEGFRLRRNLSWHQPAIYFTILAGILIYVIIALIVRQTMRVDVGLCPRHRSKRTWAIIICTLFSFGGLAVMVFGGVAAGRNAGIPILAGLVMLLFGLFYGLIGSATLTPKKIDPYFGWLKGACPEYLAGLPPSPVNQYR